MFKALFEPKHSTGFVITTALAITAVQSNFLWTAFWIALIGSIICGVMEYAVRKAKTKNTNDSS